METVLRSDPHSDRQSLLVALVVVVAILRTAELLHSHPHCLQYQLQLVHPAVQLIQLFVVHCASRESNRDHHFATMPMRIESMNEGGAKTCKSIVSVLLWLRGIRASTKL